MRTRINLDANWLFHLGEIEVPRAEWKTPVYLEAKTVSKRVGPAAREYEDGRNVDHTTEDSLLVHEMWESVTLPHDYIIRQTPDSSQTETLGYFKYENAWYRRHFTPEKPETESRAVLFFEGVAIHSTVYFNGCRMKHNHCGYNSFEVDITDLIEYGKDNVIAVHIETDEHEGWWYEGAGIYRHVYLEIQDALSVDRWGLYVHPEKKSADEWRVPVEVTLFNRQNARHTAAVRVSLIKEGGACVALAETEIEIEPYSRAEAHCETTVVAPQIWDIEDTNLYTAVAEVWVDGTLTDRVSDRFGFRTIRFDANEGFFLNDRPVKLKGVCCHQDYGLTGKAVPERVQRYRLELMKEMGANAYRCSHYPQHPYTMEMFDELGMLVMDETRWYTSTTEGLEQLEMVVKRDRNHPSVILWSIGNEEPTHETNIGKRIALSMIGALRKWDATRPVTTAVCHNPLNAEVMDAIDVLGVNYNYPDWDAIHTKWPNKPFVITESCAIGSSRDWYFPTDWERGYFTAYDYDPNEKHFSRENTWKKVDADAWNMGAFQWAGIEHRGETMWPRLCSQSGAVDMYLNRKEAFFQNQSHWTEEPMVHLLPHWNWVGREGDPIRVVAYTNCDSVQLILNGESLGEKQIEKHGHGEWRVPYVPGTIEAIGYRGGKEVCRTKKETTGAAEKLRLTVLTGKANADGRDVAILTCDCVDHEGRHVPDATPIVHFMTDDLGVVVGTGSDIADHVPPACHDRKMRGGLISVLVRAGELPGKMKVYARAEGLIGAMAEVELI